MKNVILAVSLLFTSASCNQIHDVGNAIVDCTKTDLPKLQSVVDNLRPLLDGDMPDWSMILSQAETAGVDIGGCAIAELVQTFLTSTKASNVASSQAAHEALEQARSKAGGATFHFADHNM